VGGGRVWPCYSRCLLEKRSGGEPPLIVQPEQRDDEFNGTQHDHHYFQQCAPGGLRLFVQWRGRPASLSASCPDEPCSISATKWALAAWRVARSMLASSESGVLGEDSIPACSSLRA